MEYFDVVDENDEVIGRASRKEVHDNHLIHRAVTVWIFNSKGELYMAQRSRHKDKNPLKWQAPASGHVDSGETYKEAAIRELKEECEIECDIHFEFKIKVFSDDQKEFFELYTCQFKGDTIEPTEEFERSEFMSIDKINAMIKKDRTQFRDAFLLMFDQYFS